MSRCYYLTFARVALEQNGNLVFGEQTTLFVESCPAAAYQILRAAGLAVAYGREGYAPTRDSHPKHDWDKNAGHNGPSGARR